MKPQTNTSGAVARSVKNRNFEISDLELLTVLQILIHRQRLLILDSKELPLLHQILIERLIRSVQEDSGQPPASFLDPASGTDVIQMTMGMEQVFDLDGSSTGGF